MREFTKLKMNSKRGLINKFVVYLVLMVVITIAMLLFEGNVRDMYEKSTEKNICKTSIMMQDKLAFKSFSLASDIHIKCPTKEIEIDNKEPEQVKYMFAKELYSVCDEFNRGKINLFGDEEKIFCVIRDVISFKNKDQKISGLTEYLIEEKPRNKEESYYDYCKPYETGRISNIYEKIPEWQKQDINKEPIDTNKKYAIIFVYAKGEEELREVYNFFVGGSAGHKTMYVGIGTIVLGALVVGAAPAIIVVGTFVRSVGWAVVTSGTHIFQMGGLYNFLTNPDLKQEWGSFFWVREYDEDELAKLGCDYLPAKQK